jgi:NAD(P)H dehydrogenase (quinone)
MSKNILIINGNPKDDSFCRSVALQYMAGAQQEGHAVRVLHIGEFEAARQSAPHPAAVSAMVASEKVANAQSAVTWADHIVMVYPNWWGSLPAALKSWLDTVLTPGFAFRIDAKAGSIQALLKGKTARLFITMDTPRWVYRLLFGNGGVTIMRRAVLGFCGINPVKVAKMGPLYKADLTQRTRWLEQARTLGRQAI